MKPIYSYKESRNEDKSPRAEITDKVSAMVQKAYNTQSPAIANWTDTYLSESVHGRNKQYYCSRFYPEIKLALDKFYNDEEIKNGAVEFKRKALNDNGVRYIVLTPEVSFEEAVIKAESQKVLKCPGQPRKY